MAIITLKGNPFQTLGNLPENGSKASAFSLRKKDLSNLTLEALQGFKVVLNIFPSIDTGTCANSVRTFNKKAADLENTKVICISKDLPFAHNRFCVAEGIENVHTASDISGTFSENYKLTITNGPLEGLSSRAVIVLDENGIVRYSEQVSEISEEPNYDMALKALKFDHV